MDLSVVISTYNRAFMLRDAVESVLASAEGANFTWEVILVDNNSTDNTRDMAQTLARSNSPVRYVFEPRQGASVGRNTGVERSGGKVVMFTDDDVLVAKEWLQIGYRGFDDSNIGFIMGRILPLWADGKPDWVPEKLTGPIGVCNLGESILRVERGSPHLPMTANLAIRREAFYGVGGFDTRLGPSGRHGNSDEARGYSSGEDYEFGLRLIEAGYRGIYLPSFVVYNRINAERLTKKYFRQWMFANGHAYSVMGQGREQHLSQWLGVPRYKFGQAARHATQWVGCLMQGRLHEAFLHELHLRAFAGFVSQRWTGHLSSGTR